MGLEEYEAIGRSIAQHGGTLDDVLEHYGIKGMKWGVKRSRNQIDSAPAPHDSPEHTRARELHAVASKHGARKLSNNDLRDLTQRLNLEQSFGNLHDKTKQKNAVATGAKWLGKKVGRFGEMALDEVTKAHIRVQLHEQGLLPQIPNDNKK